MNSCWDINIPVFLLLCTHAARYFCCTYFCLCALAFTIHAMNTFQNKYIYISICGHRARSWFHSQIIPPMATPCNICTSVTLVKHLHRLYIWTLYLQLKYLFHIINDLTEIASDRVTAKLRSNVAKPFYVFVLNMQFKKWVFKQLMPFQCFTNRTLSCKTVEVFFSFYLRKFVVYPSLHHRVREDHGSWRPNLVQRQNHLHTSH